VTTNRSSHMGQYHSTPFEMFPQSPTGTLLIEDKPL